MANCILWNTKLNTEASSIDRYLHGPMNVFQFFVVSEAVIFCYQQIGEEEEEHLYEHDEWISIIGPAGSQKTTTLVNTIVAFLTGKLVGRLLVQ